MTESGRRARASLLSDVDEKMDIAVVATGVAFLVILITFILSFPSLWLGLLITVLLTIAVFIAVSRDESNIVLGFVVFLLPSLLGWFMRWPAWLVATIGSAALFVIALAGEILHAART